MPTANKQLLLPFAQGLKMVGGNPWYPLPPDYPTLTPNGQRLARIAVVKRQSTPEELVQAWSFFTSYYLWPEDCFFFKRRKPPAKMHYAMVDDLARYPWTITAAPRSAAKSTVMTKSIPLLFAYTRPEMNVWCIMAKDKFVSLLFDDIKMQISENPRLWEDFGPMKPKRGQGIWSGHAIRLENKFRLGGFPISGHNRGLRPDLLLLDDVEFDPESETAGPRLTEKLERKLFTVYRPMMDEGTVLYMVGTIVRANSFLYRALYSDDPRLLSWNRRILGIRDDQGNPLWDPKWDEVTIQHLQQDMGVDFDREYLNRPRSDMGVVFKFDPKVHSYRINDIDEAWHSDPCRSTAEVSWYTRPTPDSKVLTLESKPVAEVLTDSMRFLTVDIAYKLHTHADFSCIMVMGADHLNNLWVWDMWLDKKPRDYLVEMILRMALKWRVRIIAPEAVSIQQELADILTRDTERIFAGDPTLMPIVFPIRYAQNLKKGARISALEWRFARDRILFPGDRLDIQPWRELLYQVTNFTGDEDSLRHDDAIDTLAMSNEVLRSRRIATPLAVEQRPRMEHILESSRELGTGVLSGFNAADLTLEDLSVLRGTNYDPNDQRDPRARRRAYHRETGTPGPSSRDDVLKSMSKLGFYIPGVS